MEVEALLRGLIVEGADHQAQLDAQVFRRLGQGDGLLGGGAARAGDDRLAARGGLESRLHQLDALVKGQQRGFARGAGDDQRIAQIVLDKVLDQFGIAVVIDVLVLVIGRDEREQYLSVLFLKLHGIDLISLI